MLVQKVLVAVDEECGNILLEIKEGMKVEIILKDDSILKGHVLYIEEDCLGLDMEYINNTVDVDFDYIKEIKEV